MRAVRVMVGLVVAMVVLGAACHSTARTGTPRVVVGASPDVGKDRIVHYGCGACHEIPGVKGAEGLVGPPLTKFGKRGTIAGELSNTPDNLVRWIRDPHGVEPGTDMPNLGVTNDEARNIAAYLENLQ